MPCPSPRKFAVSALCVVAVNLVIKTAFVRKFYPPACFKYGLWGDAALKGCAQCHSDMPGSEDKCMGCGKTCYMQECFGNRLKIDECVSGPAFLKCDQQCLGQGGQGADGVCAKYSSWGEQSVANCKKCQASMPGDVDKCMMCGETCWVKIGKPNNFSSDDYAKDPQFVKCDKECLGQGGQQGGDGKDADTDTDACAKYLAWGQESVEGCRKCQAHMPAKLDECMGCGKRCWMQLCTKDTSATCVKSQTFRACDEQCLNTTTTAALAEQQPVESATTKTPVTGPTKTMIVV